MKPAWRDPVVWSAVALAIFLRLLPLKVWGFGLLVRDEAQYVNLGRAIVAGKGLINPQDWLWAPAYPYLIAGFLNWVPGWVMYTLTVAQCVVGGLAVIAMYQLTLRVFDTRTARVAAWMYALHPTLIYFSGRLWSEAVYGPLLLVAVWMVLWARDGTWPRALVPGVLVALCVLMRGVALYIPPFFVLALVWPTGTQDAGEAVRAQLRHVVAFATMLLLLIAPYSMHASQKHQGLVISDATIGNLMYLGNNDFEPLTFDYGNGVLQGKARSAHTGQGRRHCRSARPPAWNQCEVRRGMDWIRGHPSAFVERMPLRVAQLVTPHSFLTRSLRGGKYRGLPWWLKESLIAGTAATTFVVLIGGLVGIVARGKGAYVWLCLGIVMYTVAASAALYGLSRFRIPLEPLWMVYAAAVIAHPGEILRAFRASSWRLGLAVVSVPALVFHMLWFLPSGWPGFNW